MDRGAAQLALFVGVGGALLIWYLATRHAGLIAANPGGDWAHHLALIDSFMRGEPPATRRDLFASLADLPSLGHVITARLAEVLRLPAIRTVHVVANAASIVACLIVAARLVWTAQRSPAPLGGMILGGIGLFLAARYGVSLSAHIEGNYFFGQLLATAIALAALLLIQTIASLPVLAIVAPAATVLIAAFHITPAIWFAAAAGSCALAFPGSWRGAVARAVGTGLLCSAAMLALPDTRAVIRMGQGGHGDVNAIVDGRLVHLTTSPLILIAAFLLLLVAIGLLVLIERRQAPARLRELLFRTHAGAVGLVLSIAAVSLGLLLSGATGTYGIAKHAFLFPVEISLLAASIGGRLLPDLGRRLLPAAAALAVLVQSPLQTGYAANQGPLLAIRDALVRQPVTVAGDNYFWPLFDRLTTNERYYIFLAMQQPAAGVAVRLMTDPNAGSDPELVARIVPPHHLLGAIEPWWGNRIAVNDRSQFLLSGGWQWPPSGAAARGTTDRPAHLFAVVPLRRSGLRLCIEAGPPPGAAGLVTASFSVNGGASAVATFDEGDGPRTIELPLPPLDAFGDLHVAIENATAAETGAGVTIASLWIATACDVPNRAAERTATPDQARAR